MATESKGLLRCSFCGKPEHKVARLLYGNGAYICNECVSLCYGMLAEDGLFPKPPGMKANMDSKKSKKGENIFLKPIIYTDSNEFMKNLFKADNLLWTEKNFTKALNIYQYLLKEIDNQKNIYIDFEKNFSFENSYYLIDENSKYIKDKNLILKLKILHSIYYIFYMRELLYDEEIVAQSILKLNKNDYYSKFYLSIINLKQGKIDECYQYVKEGIDECESVQFKSYFIKFKLFLEEFHNVK